MRSAHPPGKAGRSPATLESTLPPSCFIQVPTRRLARPHVVWRDAGAMSEAGALALAVCAPQEGEPVDAYEGEILMQKADRYGGAGVGYCGGSARCSLLDGVQIKGTGRNALHGHAPNAAPDPWHESGTMNLTEAGREIVWSRVFDAALPHGAVKNLAVLATGTFTSTSYVKAGREASCARALLLRQAVLRPAHFLRNLLHPSSPLGDGCVADAHRTREAMAVLAPALAGSFGMEAGPPHRMLNAGLLQMAGRFAAQVAAAFAKRLFHGTLGCSNIALDGRFIDFGTATSPEAYRRLATSPGGTDQWNQPEALRHTLASLREQAAAYLPRNVGMQLVAATELKQAFDDALRQRFEIEFLKLTGLPEELAHAYPAGPRRAAFEAMRQLFLRGASVPFVIRDASDPCIAGVALHRPSGACHLNASLEAAAGLHGASRSQPGATPLPASLVDLLAETRAWLAARMGSRLAAASALYLRHEALRRNAALDMLERSHLDQSLDEAATDPSRLGAFLDLTVAKAVRVVSEQPALQMPDGRAARTALEQIECLAAQPQLEPARADDCA